MAVACHLRVLGGRDLACGQAPIRVAQQVGFPGARLAWIVGGERGEHLMILPEHGHRAGGRPRPVPVSDRLPAVPARVCARR